MNKRNIYLLTQAVGIGAEAYPEREAARFSGQSLTYAELERRSNQLAHTLIAEGVQRGDRVGIYMNKGLESPVALYGIMKAGAAYVPLDPFAPVGRLSFVIRNCGIRHLVTSDFKLDGVTEMAAQTGLACAIGLSAPGELPLRTLSWEDVAAAPETPPAVSLTEQDLAYILYTSGSTGDPKGIMHTHRSGLTFAQWGVDTYELRGDDRLSNHAPLHFDLSTFDFFAGALAGATTVIIPEALTKFPVNLSRLIQNERITVWYSVPYALIQLLLNGAMERHDLSSLRWVLFAGEPFPTKHLRPLMARLPEVRFSNLYGPTETNVCTFYHVAPLPEDSDEPIPIGEACANVEALVVDGDDRPVAPGDVGELLIRSPLVMRGYWGRPDLTARGFYIRNRFDDGGEIFYRTGDLVTLEPDGNFKYLGRKDRQIKTRGYRVELDEIEVALLSHPGVEEAAVYPVPDGEGSNLIEAAVTARPGAALDVGSLLTHAAERLPPYAVPAKLTILEQFPRTSTGKINRRALQAATTVGAPA